MDIDDPRTSGKLDRPAAPDQTGDDRDRTAEERDQTAESHDEASEARDQRADARDRRAPAREQSSEGVDAGAAADRAGALRDRRGGATDRIQAADDREAASADRVLSSLERAASSMDELTGAYRRDTGMVELERDMARARRSTRPFGLCFVDVDNLKKTNDSFGHAAGDQLLRRVAEAIRARLRSYDLLIRFGGDEFLCALTDLSVAEAASRFSLVNRDLAAADQGSVTVGLAELVADDAPEDLIARADEAMYRKRRQRRSADA